nr:MAG TPA: hypothetical protein [Caudoviricetes sp.]
MKLDCERILKILINIFSEQENIETKIIIERV